MKNILAISAVFISLVSCGQTAKEKQVKPLIMSNVKEESSDKAIATLGSGCFWCVEAVYQRLKGIDTVVSGYSGGDIENPTYKQICTGTTNHAEVVQVHYNPKQISYGEILEVFFNTHDPTTLNKQGNDEGTQYRSVIFYHNDEQKQIAEAYIKQITEAKVFPKPIVTEVTSFSKFYVAEDYHQNYFNENGNQSYCVYVVRPKVEKFEKLYKDKLK